MAKPTRWNNIEYPSQAEAARTYGYSPEHLRWLLKQGFTCDKDVQSEAARGNEIKRVCFIAENRSEDVDDILSQMYYELVERHGWGLQVLIPDLPSNQSVFDIFNEPENDLHVTCVVCHTGKQSIVGSPNLRSAFVNMSNPHRSRDRLKVVKRIDDVVSFMIESCHIFVGLWDSGAMLLEPTRLANTLYKEVVLVDI